MERRGGGRTPARRGVRILGIVGKNLASGLVRNSGFIPDTSAPRPDTKLPVGRLFGEAAHTPSELASRQGAGLTDAQRLTMMEEGETREGAGEDAPDDPPRGS